MIWGLGLGGISIIPNSGESNGEETEVAVPLKLYPSIAITPHFEFSMFRRSGRGGRFFGWTIRGGFLQAWGLVFFGI